MIMKKRSGKNQGIKKKVNKSAKKGNCFVSKNLGQNKDQDQDQDCWTDLWQRIKAKVSRFSKTKHL